MAAEAAVVAVAHDHVVPDALEAPGELGQRRREGVVDEDHPVLGVVDDVGDLVGEQADVDRVQDGAEARHAEVELEVALAVPAEGRHPVALLDAEPLEDAAEALDALGDLA